MAKHVLRRESIQECHGGKQFLSGQDKQGTMRTIRAGLLFLALFVGVANGYCNLKTYKVLFDVLSRLLNVISKVATFLSAPALATSSVCAPFAVRQVLPFETFVFSFV